MLFYSAPGRISANTFVRFIISGFSFYTNTANKVAGYFLCCRNHMTFRCCSMLADRRFRDATCSHRTNMVARDKITAFFITAGIPLRVGNNAILIRHTFTSCPIKSFTVSATIVRYVGTGQLVAIRRHVYVVTDFLRRCTPIAAKLR